MWEGLPLCLGRSCTCGVAYADVVVDAVAGIIATAADDTEDAAALSAGLSL